MAGYDDFDGNQVKHMEMIQAVVARLAGNSFLIKGWAITLTGAFLGFALNREDAGLAAVAFVPIFFFWALDAYYLRCERLFRVLFGRVRSDTPVEPFFMAATDPTFIKSAPDDVRPWWSTLVRGTVWGFYVPLAVVTAIVVVVICTG